MAKWGQGDPRWIVEARPDGTNVNNWHWVEKNATSWSKDKLKELLQGLRVEGNGVSCEVMELTKMDGEATANNRKGKLIIFYEWEIEGSWTGRSSTDGKKIKGKFTIPNLSDENEAHEIDVEVTTESSSDEAFKVKEVMRIQGRDLIRDRLSTYIRELREEYSKDIIKPTKGSCPAPAVQQKNDENRYKSELNKFVPSKAEVGVRIDTKKLTMLEEFHCSAQDLYRALTDKQMVEAFTGGEAVFEATKGERFALMGGNITGEFVELVPEKKIVQKWRVKSWPAEHYSQVTMELEQLDCSTKLHITQTGVPSSEYEKTREGWKMHYWERIRQMFGFGARLF